MRLGPCGAEWPAPGPQPEGRGRAGVASPVPGWQAHPAASLAGRAARRPLSAGTVGRVLAPGGGAGGKGLRVAQASPATALRTLQRRPAGDPAHNRVANSLGTHLGGLRLSRRLPRGRPFVGRRSCPTQRALQPLPDQRTDGAEELRGGTGTRRHGPRGPRGRRRGGCRRGRGRVRSRLPRPIPAAVTRVVEGRGIAS